MTSFETIGAAAGVCGIMIVMDVAAGVLSAATRGELNTTKLRHGLFHKLGLVLTYALAVALEYACDVLPLGIDMPLVIPVAAYITLMEAMSVYENVKQINPDIKVEKFEDLFKFSHGDGIVPAQHTDVTVPPLLDDERLERVAESKAKIINDIWGDRAEEVWGDEDARRALKRYMEKFLEDYDE